MHAVRYRFRSELRARWRAWLVLAMLIGAVAGVSLVLIAGSRRTGTAHDRFRAGQRAFDVALAVSCRPGAPPGAGADTSCLEEIGRLGAVESATTFSDVPAFVETVDGRSIQPDEADPCYSGPGMVGTGYDASGGFGTRINGYRFVAGRAANPATADEVVISQDTADRLRLRPGSQLRIRLFGNASCEDPPAEWQAPRRVRIVGVQISPGEIRPPSGTFLQTVTVTPAFVRRAGVVPGGSEYLAVRLRPDSSVGELRAQAQKLGYETEVAASQADSQRAVQRGIRPNEVSLQILAALTALAGAAVLGQILVRQTFVESDDDAALSALGMRTGERVFLAALRGGTVGLGAAVVAIATAVIASPIMPIGLARRIEPDRGFSFDGSVLAVGGFVTVLFVVAVVAATATRLALRADREVRVKRATLAGFAASAGFSPTAVSGARLALERGGGTTGVPVASSFAGLTVAVAAVVGALTFGAGLTHLQATPRLIGWNWDVVVTVPQEEGPSPELLADARTRAERAFAAHGVIDAVRGTLWSPFPYGRDLQVGPDHADVGGFIAFDGSARLGPSVITGRKPLQADEIMLGPRTLSTLGLHIGDVVDVVGQAGTWDSPGEETSTRMRIVGTGLAPMTESLGRGAAVTLEGLRRLSPDATEQAWFVQLRPGSDRASFVDAYRAAFPRETRASIETFGLEKIDQAGLTLEQVESVPALFAVIMGLMAAAVLAHVLAVGARARRRDLAVLRALGFTRGQVLRTVGWQSTIYAVGALAIGVPAGVALGRSAWREYAANLGAVPEPISPLVGCALIAVITLALAGVLAIAPALRIARTRPGAVLRTE